MVGVGVSLGGKSCTKVAMLQAECTGNYFDLQCVHSQTLGERGRAIERERHEREIDR